MASLPPDVMLIPSVLEFQCSFMILIHAAKYHHFARSNGKLQVAFSVFVTVPRNIPGDEAPGIDAGTVLRRMKRLSERKEHGCAL